MPFKGKKRASYKTRVTLPDGSSIVAGCGTRDLPTAVAMEAMVRRLREKRRWDVLRLIVERRAKLPEVFDAYDAGTLDDFLARLSSPDLVSLFRDWPGKPRYKIQVKRFLGTNTYPATRFTRKAVSEFLSELDVSGSTKNRYRSALSVFARWLVEREVIDANPVRDVQGAKPNPGRLIWLEREQAKALVNSLPSPNRAIEALMAATGIEWQAVARVRRRDVDLTARSVHAQGGKTRWRNRVVRGTEEWAWEIFAEYARDFTPAALLFDGVDRFRALDIHKAASKRLDLPATTLHDWRHTYAVQALRDGYSLSVVAHQLGHHDTYLVQTRYGRHVPDERDYIRHQAAVPSRQAAGRED